MNLTLNNNARNRSDIRFQNGPIMLNHQQIQGQQQPQVEENKRYMVTENHYYRLSEQIQNEMECAICMMEFDLQRHVPMMICRNQHNCCLECAKNALIRKDECPFCRVQIEISEVKKNQMIVDTIQNSAQKRGKRLSVGRNPQQQLIIRNIYGGIFDYSAIMQRRREQNIMQRRRQQNRRRNHSNRSTDESTFFSRFFGPQHYEIYRISIFFVMFCNFPFMIYELVYAFLIEDQQCLDKEYVNKFSLRTWFEVSGLFGLVLYLATFFGIVVLLGVFGNQYERYSHVVGNVVLIILALKISAWNIFGFVIILIVNNLEECIETSNYYAIFLFFVLLASIPLSPALIITVHKYWNSD